MICRIYFPYQELNFSLNILSKRCIWIQLSFEATVLVSLHIDEEYWVPVTMQRIVILYYNQTNKIMMLVRIYNIYKKPGMGFLL